MSDQIIDILSRPYVVQQISYNLFQANVPDVQLLRISEVRLTQSVDVPASRLHFDSVGSVHSFALL